MRLLRRAAFASDHLKRFGTRRYLYSKASEIAEQKLNSPFNCLSVGSARGGSVVSTRWQHLCVVNGSTGPAGRTGGSVTRNGGRMKW
jgi:hypothetical protein